MSTNPTLEKPALFVTAASAFISSFVIPSVNVALPALQQDFNLNAVQLNWTTTVLLLAIAVALVPAGRIADIYGRKKIFLWGLVLFSLSSFLLIFANTFKLFIFLRAIQGFGTALFTTTGMAIISSIFPPNRRGKAIGIYTSSVYIGLTIGPFVGGVLTEQFGWQSIFAVITPLGVASVWITLKYLKGEWAEARGETLDITGSIFYMIAILAIVYGASFIPDIKALYLIGGGFLFLAAFVWQELKVPFPVFEVRLFMHNKLFTFSSLAALIHYASMFGIGFLLSLYLQYIKGYSPQTAGTILVAQPIVMALFAPLAGKLSDRMDPGKLASIGMLITALGLLFFAFIGTETSIGLMVAVLALMGFGVALFSSPNMNAIMGAVEKRYLGIASGALSTMRLLGQMASMAIVMVVFALLIGRAQITPENYALFLKSIHLLFFIFTFLCLLAVFFSLLRGHPNSDSSK